MLLLNRLEQEDPLPFPSDISNLGRGGGSKEVKETVFGTAACSDRQTELA